MTNAERSAMLEQRRLAKMARSAHAFVRGNTVDHYGWLGELSGLPEGPPVWICGDCHVGNLGPIANGTGRVEVQIRDLDQTTIGNPAHDLVRLALSLASAARGSDLPGATTAHVVDAMVDGYAKGLASTGEDPPAEEPETVATVRREALGRKWRHLARERIGAIRPNIPLGKRFWELSDDERWNLGMLLDSPSVKKLILTLNKRGEDAKVELLDAAYWMKGCSSLGKLRFAALVQVSEGRRNKLGLIDVKEAVASAAPAAPGIAIPQNHADRVVAGARALSPYLGDRLAAATLNDRPVVVRELMPEDLKLEMEQFSRHEAVTAARYLAAVVGKAHGRQMKADERIAWTRDLQRHSAGADAPKWLWEPVVALLVRHEGAYLEHCRLQARLEAA